MKTKMKTTLFTLIFLFVLATSVHAQDKYEYAIVNQELNYIEITTNTYQQIKIAKGENKNVELIKKVQEMESERWEVFNTAVTITGSIHYHFFYLRRKKE